MYDISKERKIEFIKIGENRNLIRLSTAYDTNCSECDYVEVNDETLGSVRNIFRGGAGSLLRPFFGRKRKS